MIILNRVKVKIIFRDARNFELYKKKNKNSEIFLILFFNGEEVYRSIFIMMILYPSLMSQLRFSTFHFISFYTKHKKKIQNNNNNNSSKLKRLKNVEKINENHLRKKPGRGKK
jgi:hypothetical protein